MEHNGGCAYLNLLEGQEKTLLDSNDVLFTYMSAGGLLFLLLFFFFNVAIDCCL